MRKHYKIITGIACIVLCLAIVAFGVYAASTSLVTLGANVSFTPSSAKLTIQGGIAGSIEVKDSQKTPENAQVNYFATNYKNTSQGVTESNVDSETVANFPTWNYIAATFDSDYVETAEKTHPDPIYFFIQITNHVERNVNISVDLISPYTEETNIKVSTLYSLLSNSAFTDSENTTHMYSLSNNDAPEQDITDVLVTKMSLYTQKDEFNDIKYQPETPEINFNFLNESSTTSLSTLMIVMKLEVINAEENVDSANTPFNFAITVK